MDRTQYQELITLTKQYIEQEYKETKMLFSDQETLCYFKETSDTTYLLKTEGTKEEAALLTKIAGAIQNNLGQKAKVVSTLPDERPRLLLAQKRPEDKKTPWIELKPSPMYLSNPENKKELWNAVANFYKK